MWNTAKVIWPFFAASMKPMSRSERKRRRQQSGAHVDHRHGGVGGRRVSKIFIWSGTEVMSTTSVMSG